MGVRTCVCVCVCVCVSEREREKERERACICKNEERGGEGYAEGMCARANTYDHSAWRHHDWPNDTQHNDTNNKK
jgi:hypothetical protein